MWNGNKKNTKLASDYKNKSGCPLGETVLDGGRAHMS